MALKGVAMSSSLPGDTLVLLKPYFALKILGLRKKDFKRYDYITIVDG